MSTRTDTVRLEWLFGHASGEPGTTWVEGPDGRTLFVLVRHESVEPDEIRRALDAAMDAEQAEGESDD